MSAGPTWDQLERRLRSKLLDTNTHIRLGQLTRLAGLVEYDDSGNEPVRIKVDPMWVGIVGTVMHELLHVELDAVVAQLGEAEEVAIEAIGNAMLERVYKSERRSRWWRTNIARRVKIERALVGK
jgi:hypothetical protein